MPRPPLALGSWGNINRTEVEPGRFKARCRFRDFDGHTRLVEAWGKSGAAAERALVLALMDRSAPSGDHITGNTRLSELAVVWLHEIERSNLAANSRPISRTGRAAHHARRGWPDDPRGDGRPVGPVHPGSG